MDLYPTKMSQFKANAFGLATSLSKTLESVGLKNAKDTKITEKMLNNSTTNDQLFNYNYSPLTAADPVASTSQTSPNSSRYSKYDPDSTPRCMRPKSLSFHEEGQLQEDQSSSPNSHNPTSPVSPPLLTSSTNPFLPSASRFSTKQFIFNDLRGRGSPEPSEQYQEMQELKPIKKSTYLETDFENEAGAGGKGTYKLNLGVPMVGMVPNAELVKINTQPATSPVPAASEMRPIAAIHPSQAVPLSSIFGLPEVSPQPVEIPQSLPTPPPAVATLASQTPPIVPVPVPTDSTQPILFPVNPNSKSTDIF